MELKAKEDMYEVNYPSKEENKNNFWRLIINTKKISLGILCFYLILTRGIAATFDSFSIDDAAIVGGLQNNVGEVLFDLVMCGVGIAVGAIVIGYAVLKIKNKFIKTHKKTSSDEQDE